MTRRLGAVIVSLSVAGLLLSGASASARQDRVTPQTVEFLRLARRVPPSSEAYDYLQSLPVREQLQVARGILYDEDAHIAYGGAFILIDRGRAAEAVPGLAAIIASGRNETQLNGRMGYDWLHNDDQGLFLRMMIMIGKYLLAKLDKYPGDERRRVEAFLMSDMPDAAGQPFSKAQAEKNVASWERALREMR